MTAAVQSAAARRRHTAAAAAAAAGIKVDEIDKKFRADAADEALRMPMIGRPSA